VVVVYALVADALKVGDSNLLQLPHIATGRNAALMSARTKTPIFVSNVMRMRKNL